MNNLNIVWTAVIATLASALAVIVSIWGSPDVAVALGATAITFAILSSRER